MVFLFDPAAKGENSILNFAAMKIHKEGYRLIFLFFLFNAAIATAVYFIPG
jgi:hypothetical protein